jgi:outer membrane protein insertion porin family
MHLGLLILATLLLPTQPASHSHSQQAAGTARLVSVEVTGSHRFASNDIVGVTALRPGGDVKKEDLQAAADALAQQGLFASVQYRFSSVPTGVKVEYQVTDAPSVPVTFDNFPWLTDDEIDSALKTSVVLFDGRAPQSGAILDKMSIALQKLVAERGVHEAVSHNLVTGPDNKQLVQLFRIEGPVLKVQGVEFSDPLAANDRGIQQGLPTLIGKPFSRATFELFEFEQVRPLYLSHAFLRVKFGRPLPRFTGNPNGPLPDSVIVVAPIDPGPPYTWGGVAWNGAKLVRSAELEKLVELRPGEVADGLKVEGTWQQVRDAYARLGYLDADVNPVPQFDDAAARVRYTVTITEGPQYHMGKLVLTGLSLEGERRIRVAWTMVPGAVFDKEAYEDFLSTGVTHAFQGLPFHYQKIGRFLQEDPNTGKVDVMLDFQ